MQCNQYFYKQKSIKTNNYFKLSTSKKIFIELIIILLLLKLHNFASTFELLYLYLNYDIVKVFLLF